MVQSKIKKTVIILGYKCNNRCKFCYSADKRSFLERDTNGLLMDIAKAKRGGSTYLEFIGGEPTIREDILRLIEFAKRNEYSVISLTTNGRMFAYKDFTKKIIAAGLTHLVFSIHGHTDKLHDELTQSQGSFKQLKQGLANLQEAGFRNIGTNTTIVKQNYKSLPKIGEFIYKAQVRNSEFIFVDPSRGGAFDDFFGLVPRISEAAPYIIKCLKLGRGEGILHWHIRYVPLCYFADYQNQISEIHERETFHTQHIASDFKNFDVENSRMEFGRIKTEKCKGCKKFSICEGLWREYYKHYGDSELVPFL